jgi:hypothetical protein
MIQAQRGAIKVDRVTLRVVAEPPPEAPTGRNSKAQVGAKRRPGITHTQTTKL